jgi:hypothetical protein
MCAINLSRLHSRLSDGGVLMPVAGHMIGLRQRTIGPAKNAPCPNVPRCAHSTPCDRHTTLNVIARVW